MQRLNVAAGLRPQAALQTLGPNQRIQVKMLTVDGTVDLRNNYFDDQTRFTPWLGPGI